jgi:hypothetical protein
MMVNLLLQRIRKVLTPYEVSYIKDISGGVGTPNIVYDVKRDIYYLLFTGWSDPIGLKREGFVVEIDRNFNIRWETLKKILSRDFPEPVNYTHNTIRGVYNPAVDEFIVTSSHENRIYIYKFDPDWRLKEYKLLFQYPRTRDFGAPIKPFGAYGKLHDALTATPDGEYNEFIKLFTLRNVDDFSKIDVIDHGEAGRWGLGNDVIDMSTIPRIQIFVEHDTFSKWSIHTFIGPSPDEIKTDHIGNVFMLQGSLAPLLPIDDNLVQVGHPHYTTLPDGVPKLLLASFRDTWSSRRDTGREGYTHEIWYVTIDQRIFDPRSYGELRGLLTGKGGKWIYVRSAERLNLVPSKSCEGQILYKNSLDDEASAEPIKLEKGKKAIIEAPTTWISFLFTGECYVSITASYS